MDNPFEEVLGSHRTPRRASPTHVTSALYLQDPQRISEEHLLHRLLIEARKCSPGEHIVQLAHSVQAGVDGCERIVRSKQHLVPHTILLNQHQRVIELKGPIMQS